MKKRTYIGALLMGCLLLGTGFSVTSCKDYDDDINNLQAQIDDLNKRVDQINDLVTSGSTITKIEPTSTGIKVTLKSKDNKEVSYDLITNEKAGTTWTIQDGYWYQNGTKTDYVAKKGSDTGYYVPNADGYFYKVSADGKTQEKTTIQWKTNESNIYGVMNDSELILYNVPDENGTVNKDGIHIALSNSLRGLVFEKDNSGKRTYVDGVPGIRITSFSYGAQTLSNHDTPNEVAIPSSKSTVVNPATYAYYHVNPSNANVEDLKKLTYVVKPNADYLQTRTDKDASADFGAKAEFVEFKDGILKVKVDVAGTPAEGNKISVAALQAFDRKNVSVTSDYATFYKKDMSQLRLADAEKFSAAKPEDYHYRRAAIGISKVDNDAGIKKAVWPTQDGSDADYELEYDGQLDLKTKVGVHELDGKVAGIGKCAPADLQALGFAIKYEIVHNYKIGTNQTNQEDFIDLKDGVLTAKVFQDDKKYAAVGRTPVIRVSLVDTKNNNQVVEYAYIKVKIVKKAVENKQIALTFDNGFSFVCGTNGVVKTSVEQMNVKVYNEMGMEKKDFHNFYKYFEDVEGYGTVKELIDDKNSETTHLIQWTLTPDQMWAKANEEVTHTVRYATAPGSDQYVTIILKAQVKDIKKAYNITTSEYVNNYWNEEKTYAKFNVATPDQGSREADKCIFKNDLNNIFKSTNGRIDLDKAITDRKFSFDKKIESVSKVGDIAVKFAVVDNGEGLNATVNGITEKVATINNNGTAVPYNYVELNKGSNIAKQLLNTNQFDVYYSIKANVCNEPSKQVTVTFNGQSYFTARFLQPVKIASKSKGYFVDGLDFGAEHTYLKLEDLISPSDWRGYSFSDNANYWDYYGEFKITADLDHAKCDLNIGGNTDLKDVPATIKLSPEGAGFKPGSKYGFITYRNNGSVVQSDFNLYIKVNVEYGWGIIQTDYITVPVKKTVGQ